jgi:23S rRNA (uridine2552-2'-O)-methyltransferase
MASLRPFDSLAGAYLGYAPRPSAAILAFMIQEAVDSSYKILHIAEHFTCLYTFLHSRYNGRVCRKMSFVLYGASRKRKVIQGGCLMPYTFRDHYFQRAKKDHYLARAVYKLEEIQLKYRIMRNGSRVLDLGAFPGSWLQLTSEIIGPSGLAVGVDVKGLEHRFPKNVVALERDVFDPGFVDELLNGYAPFDVVLSDMAPATSGVRVADSARSARLFERALDIAALTLRPQGHFLAKIFQGSEFHDLLVCVKRQFEWVRVVKPDASRKMSKEIYILSMRFKKPL